MKRANMMKLVRRVHLYLGLLMVPWVFLYGSTALLFNHSQWFTERTFVDVPAYTPLELPDASGLAEEAVVGLDGVDVVDGSARWNGDFEFRGRAPGRSVRARLARDGSGGRVRIRPDDAKPPMWTDSLKAFEPLKSKRRGLTDGGREQIQDVVPGLKRLDLSNVPALEYAVEADGVRYWVEMDLHGSVDVVPLGEATSWRSRAVDLHTMHESPGYFGGQWVWARFVDLMGLAMLSWGVTGLVMWWSMRGLRRTGSVVLSFGVGSMVLLALTLWSALGI